MEYAIILNGKQIKKIVKNKKFNKIINNPNIKILEECNEENVDERFDYWDKIINPKTEEKEEKIKVYYFKNNKTGYSITSIYPDLEHCKSCVLDWEDYERID